MYESYFIDFVYSELKFKTKNAPPIQDAQDYILLTQYKYTIKDLKSIIKRLMLPKCKKTKKKELLHFCTNILYLSFFILFAIGKYIVSEFSFQHNSSSNLSIATNIGFTTYSVSAFSSPSCINRTIFLQKET